MRIYCIVLGVCLLKYHILNISKNMNQTLMVKALLVVTCSWNVFCSQSHKKYTSHVEADLCRLKLNVTARVGVSPLTALIPPKLIAGNWKRATHATMTTQKQLHHPKRVTQHMQQWHPKNCSSQPQWKGHPNQVWQISNNDTPNCRLWAYLW